MATTSIRWAVAKHLVGLLRGHAALAGVQVEAGWPGTENPAPEAIWIDELAGTVEIPVMSAGRKQRDDRFTVPFEIRVAGKVDFDATAARIAVLTAAIEDVLANDPTLGNFDGVVSAEITDERQTCARTPDGMLGFAEVVVSVHARLL